MVAISVRFPLPTLFVAGSRLHVPGSDGLWGLSCSRISSRRAWSLLRFPVTLFTPKSNSSFRNWVSILRWVQRLGSFFHVLYDPELRCDRPIWLEFAFSINSVVVIVNLTMIIINDYCNHHNCHRCCRLFLLSSPSSSSSSSSSSPVIVVILVAHQCQQ